MCATEHCVAPTSPCGVPRFLATQVARLEFHRAVTGFRLAGLNDSEGRQLFLCDRGIFVAAVKSAQIGRGITLRSQFTVRCPLTSLHYPFFPIPMDFAVNLLPSGHRRPREGPLTG